MKTTGTFRLSYNRAGAAPLVWSIALVPADADAPICELAVPAFGIEGALVTSRYRPKATPDDEDGKPSAWLEVVGELEVLADGSAVIRAVRDVPEAAQPRRCSGCGGLDILVSFDEDERGYCSECTDRHRREGLVP